MGEIYGKQKEENQDNNLHCNYSVFFHCNDRILHTVEKGRYRYNRLFKNRHGLEHSLGDDYTFFPSKTCVQEKSPCNRAGLKGRNMKKEDFVNK